VLGSHCVLWTRNQAPVNHLSETFTKLSFHHYPSFFAPPDFDLVLWHVSFLYDILEYSIDSSPAAYLDQDDTERVYIMLTAERRVRLTLSFGVPVQVGESNTSWFAILFVLASLGRAIPQPARYGTAKASRRRCFVLGESVMTTPLLHMFL
jgi:hypothetical protein